MPITTDAEGRFLGEGWVTGSPRGAFWMRADGWAWFPAESVWRYMLFMRAGGPTWESWQAAGMPVFSPEPTAPPQTEATPGLAASAITTPESGTDRTPLGTLPFAGPTGGATPGRWDGQGWEQEGDDWIFKQGDGHFWSNNRQEWTRRPDLLTGVLPSPGPVPMAVKAQSEVTRLRTGWPTYGEAWKAAKAGRWFCRKYVLWSLLLIPAMWGGGLLFLVFWVQRDYDWQSSEPEPVLPNWWAYLIITMILLVPAMAWRVYHRHLGTLDRKKQRAFSVATYAATAAAAHTARRHGERHPSAPVNPPGWTPEKGFDDQRLNSVMRQQ